MCATDIGDYLKANVLDPFGMRSSGHIWNADYEMRVAQVTIWTVASATRGEERAPWTRHATRQPAACTRLRQAGKFFTGSSVT